jgi:hypothetical protein
VVTLKAATLSLYGRRAIVAAAVAFAAPAFAANYRFEVPREVVTVTVNADSSLDIDYRILFRNSPGADAIDIVDIGFPTKDYELSSVSADLNGTPLGGIKPSTYIEVGVEIPLGGAAIAPGREGLLHVHGRNPRMVWADSRDEAYASCVFSPTWFGSDFTSGVTHLTMVFVFPPGVTGEQTRWHDAEGGKPSSAAFRDNRVHYIWDMTDASPSTQYKFGVSFPANTVAEVRKPNPLADFFTGLVTALVALVAVAAKSCGCILPVALFAFLAILGVVNGRRRRMRYLSPKAKVEGVGIKRGLTAPEAALLMETPLNKVLTLILFGLLKKNALTVTATEPLKLKARTPRPDGLKPYETDFLGAIEADGDLDEKKLRPMLVEMIRSLETKMKGFSHKETVVYYRSIVATAWKLVETGATPTVKAEEFTNSLEWTLLDEKFGDRTREVFADTVVPMPYWWSFGHFPAPAAPATGGAGVPALDIPTLPGANFANTVVTQVEGFAHTVVSKVESFTGTVTSVTNPPPVSTSSGGGHSGGGCACACACAGCACACAGGGR